MRLCSVFVCTCLASIAKAEAKELEFPTVWDVDDNADGITLDLDWVEVDPGFGGGPFQTRGLGGSIPGPTIKLSAGKTLKVHFRNLLKDQPESYKSSSPGRLNQYNDPDTGNLHFHGGHVSSVLPADDTSLAVPPGQHYNFSVPFPEHHMPGLHWVHPHHHGSSSLHLVGGAALALIVKDPPGTLPQEVGNAEEKVLVFQDWDIPKARAIARKAGDAAFASSLEAIQGGKEVGQRFVTINGMYQPTMTVTQGVWQRWRILYAGWQDLPLNLKTITNEAGCEFQLLAKDGIFIDDYPRLISGPIPLPPGGRADFMVRCNSIGTASFSAMSREILELVSQSPTTSLADTAIARETSLFSQNVTAQEDTEGPVAVLPAWKPPSYPDYLQSVREELPTDGCTCPYVLLGYDDTSRINGEIYRPGNHYMHTTYLGAVVQRDLQGIEEHSYHQHIYPFQLVSGFKESEYFQYGDWHDTLLDVKGKASTGTTTWVIKYRTTDIAGKMMVHCHNTMHADHGMLQKEYVRELKSEGSCECDIVGPISGPGLVDDVNKITVVGGSPTKELDNVDGDGNLSSAGSSSVTLVIPCVLILAFFV